MAINIRKATSATGGSQRNFRPSVLPPLKAPGYAYPGFSWRLSVSRLLYLISVALLLQGAAWAATASLIVSGPQSGTTYYAGDTFTLTVTGAANAAVTVSQNGGAQGSVGTTNSSGVWSTTSSWNSSNIGTYTQVWYVAGVAAPTLSFSVKALPAATASIVVTGPKSGNTYYVGDSYTITVTGAPNAPVTVYQNGAQSGQLGTTNSSGVWSTSGTWTTASIGTYVQTWQVAGMAAPTLTSYVAAIPSYTISGSAGVASATVTLSGSQSGSTTSNGAGSYSFSVLAFGNYTITPSKPFYTFTPTSASFTNLSVPQTANFTATAIGPTITSLSPPSTTVGSVAFTLTVNGTNYVAGAAVKWNSSALTTTLVSATRLTAVVAAALVASVGTASITVTTSAGTSAPATFTIAGLTMAITGVSRPSGSPGTSIVISGNSFGATQGGSTVTFNGVSAAVQIWSATSVTVTVPFTATSGSIVVTVGGVASNGWPFTVLPTREYIHMNGRVIAVENN